MTLGNRIQTLRKAAGLSQDALGERHVVEVAAPPDQWNRCTAEVVLPAIEGGYVVRLAVDEDGARRVETLRPAPICQSYKGGGTEDITDWGCSTRLCSEEKRSWTARRPICWKVNLLGITRWI